MSGAPTGWSAPKTDWAVGNVPTAADFNRAEGNSSAIESGDRTLDQALASPANVGTLRQILSWFAGRLKAITGAAHWYSSPDATLADAKSHHDATTAHSAVSAATANRIIIRDASGRARVAAPSDSTDIARKEEVDAMVPLAGGTMTGKLYPQNNTDYTTGQARRIILSTADPSGGGNGDVWLKYEA